MTLTLLRQAATFDWSKVQPEVFGTLFQHSMDDDERHAFGAHFTSPSDIMKIVGPTFLPANLGKFPVARPALTFPLRFKFQLTPLNSNYKKLETLKVT